MRLTPLFLCWLYAGLLSAQSLYFPPVNGNEWETTTPESLSWCTDSIQPLYDFLEAEETKAFLVLKDGRIVLEHYFGNFKQNNVWYWASAGKSLTSFLVGLAQQQGSLSLDDPTSLYLGQGWTSCDSLAENQRTIWHQLTMTTGFDDGFPNFDCLSPSCLHCIAEVGERWAYHNSPYTLLDSVLFYSTGQDATDFFQSHLATQTGMSGNYTQIGNNHVFFSTPRVMARFGLLMLNQGSWNQTPILTDADYYQSMIHPSQNLNPAYGYLWWLNGQDFYRLPQTQNVFSGALIPHAPADMYAALGKNGQLLNVVPSENLVVVRMGKSSGQFLVETQLNDKIWEYLNAIRCQTVAVQKPDLAPVLRLSPNPTQGKITINAHPHFAQAELKIINAQGQVIFTKAYNELTNKELDLSFLPKGRYFMWIKTAQSIFVRQITKE